MKKHFMLMLALALGIGMAQAHPVSVSQAKYVGQQFVQANFEQLRQSQDLSLVYTGTSTRGEACFYVFNVGDNGFVMVSADDFYRPIIGYSDEGIFDVNINPELNHMLDALISARSDKLTGEPTPAVAAEWNMVSNKGELMSFNGGRARFYLCQTKWNQNYPYNYYCPEMAGGPGGHVYAGCVACAMSQMMKYWNHPLQGTGSHTYTSHGTNYPTIPNITANFGETTYDWDNMPVSITANSPQEQIDAVATLMFHCGVAVDMMYDIDGSGAYSTDVPQSINQYFNYTDQAVLNRRDDYTYDNWASMMKESFDMGWPLYYSGQSSSGGHAFVCDGYDDANLFHYNWGWGGTDDGFFDFDNIEYNNSDGAIFNFVPADIYKETAEAPTNISVTPAANNELLATLSWTNPSQTLDNTALSGIDQIVVCRNGEIIYSEDNVTSGAAMTYVDNEVPRFDDFVYTVYAVCNGNHGKVAYSDKVSFGPTCSWTINITQASLTGFRGGAIHLYNASGTEVATVTTTTSAIQAIPVDVPLGHVSFGWSAQTNGSAFAMAFTIKDSQNNVVYSYSGSSTDFPEGIFVEANNGCGNQPGTGVPSNLVVIRDEENSYIIHGSWDGINDSGYGYTVYRDGLLHRIIPEGTTFTDKNVPIGGHCYRIGFLSDGGENSGYSNESCASSGACYAPSNLDYEITSTFKIKLKWEKPNPAEGLSGYYLYRTTTENGEYERIKLLGINATSYTDHTANEEGHYYYKLYAVYLDLDCVSAPANWKYDSNQFYLHVYYSPTSVDENESTNVSIFPNPADHSLSIETEGMRHVKVCNLLGQVVLDCDIECNQLNINTSIWSEGIYLIVLQSEHGTVTHRVSILH